MTSIVDNNKESILKVKIRGTGSACRDTRWGDIYSKFTLLKNVIDSSNMVLLTYGLSFLSPTAATALAETS